MRRPSRISSRLLVFAQKIHTRPGGYPRRRAGPLPGQPDRAAPAAARAAMKVGLNGPGRGRERESRKGRGNYGLCSHPAFFYESFISLPDPALEKNLRLAYY